MDVLALIAERKILEAMERGELNDLPGAGKPLRLEDDAMVPEDVRLAYRVLKNAGFLPPEIELRKEILSLAELIRSIEDDGERKRRIGELNRKMLRLAVMTKRPVTFDFLPEYRDKLLDKLAG